MYRLTTQRAQDLLDAARSLQVLVVGDVMLDVYLRGAALRISPEAPVPVVRVEEEWRALGGAANVAANVVALGAGCSVVGCAGTDRAAAELVSELERAGIETAGLVRVEGRPTTVKTRIMARQQQVARFDSEHELDLDDGVCDLVSQRIETLARGAHAIVLEDYNKGVLTRSIIGSALRAAQAHGLPVVVDPKSRHFFDYRGATVFKPNVAELGAAVRDRVFPDDAAWLDRVRREIGCAHLLLTLGEDGMALMTEDGDHVRIPTVARSVYDVSGAGDTVTAVMAVALAAGATPIEAAVLANHAAGIEVGKAGVATVSRQELLGVIEEHAERAALGRVVEP